MQTVALPVENVSASQDVHWALPVKALNVPGSHGTQGRVNLVPVYVADCSNHASVQEVVCEGYACFIPDLPPEEREGSCRGVGDPVAHLGQL